MTNTDETPDDRARPRQAGRATAGPAAASLGAAGAEGAAGAAGALSRRVMLRGAALGGLSVPLLAACGGGEESSGSAASDGSSSAASSGSADASGSGGDPGGVTVATSEVPVGGGAVFPDEKLVVTQPGAGEYKAFSAVCTHQQCLVSEVTDEEIVCKCHGSRFSISDGSPVQGPATEPLGARKVSVQGGEITVT